MDQVRDAKDRLKQLVKDRQAIKDADHLKTEAEAAVGALGPTQGWLAET